MKDTLHFLGIDQADKRIRLFSNIQNEQEELVEASIWRFPKLGDKPRFRPTDAKRVDIGEKTSVIIATHGAIFEVPFNYKGKITFAKTYRSCHSVEKLPDGNLISASSKHGKLRLHFGPSERSDNLILKSWKDYDLKFAHGVVFDKTSNNIWALGVHLNKYKYTQDPTPSLELIQTYNIPEKSGHDLFPDGKGNLMLSTNRAIYKFDIDKESLELIADLKSVKSIVSDIQTNDIFLTIPTPKLGYKRWQSHTILNHTHFKKIKRKKAKFYKVRLWQKNTFSY